MKNEIEEKKKEERQKQIRVLTHEIMNTVTPITSLSSSLYNIIETSKIKNEIIDKKSIEYLSDGLEAIIDRSTGLTSFVEAYKNLTRIPPPKFVKVSTIGFFNRIELLFLQDFKNKNIKYRVNINKGCEELFFDKELMEQVIINLIKNSIESLNNTLNPQIVIDILKEQSHKTIILITDNGEGISQESIDKIFIPFFSTKEKGTGIGLSLSRQILRLHKGTINVKSIPNKETIFTLVF